MGCGGSGGVQNWQLYISDDHDMMSHMYMLTALKQ